MTHPSGPESSSAEPHLGGLVKHSAIYSAAPIVRQLVSAGMQRFYTGWLGTSASGVKEIVDFWMIALQQLLGQNLLGAMVRFYYEQREERERRAVVTSCTLVIALLAWLVCGAAWFASPSLAPLVLGQGEVVLHDELVQILELSLLLVPLQLSTLSGFYYLQTLKRSGLYTLIQTAKFFVEVGLNFWFIGHEGLGVRGFLLSMLCGEVLTSLGLTGWMLVRLRPRFDARVFGPILSYSLPLVPVGVCQLMLHQLDRRLLLSFSPEGEGQAAAGIYGHGYRIGYLVTAMMLGPFVQIFQPWIFSVPDERERARSVARVSTYAVLVIGAASLGVTCVGREVAILLSGRVEFYEAWRVVPWVATGYVFWALYHVSQMPLFLSKRTGRLFAINVCAVVINVGANAWLIPRFGFEGAALATALTFVCLASLGLLAGRRDAHVPFEIGRLATILAIVVAGGVLTRWLDASVAEGVLAWPSALAVKLAVGLCLCAAMWRLALRSEERRAFRAWIRQVLGADPRG
jgi:O-antigen/teichoic acid export membrane protein